MGTPMVLVTYDLPPPVVEFTWEQSFPIYPPPYGKIGAGLGVKIDLAFGYDTRGVELFAEGGFENPLDLLAKDGLEHGPQAGVVVDDQHGGTGLPHAGGISTIILVPPGEPGS